MSTVNPKDLHPEVWKLFDRYVHGLIDRRGFLDGAGKYAVGGATAAAYGAPRAEDVPKIRAAMLIQYAQDDERINAMWPAYEAALAWQGTIAHFKQHLVA